MDAKKKKRQQLDGEKSGGQLSFKADNIG